MSYLRILIIEDFDEFRRLVVSLLQKSARFHAIYESSDGLDGFRQALELRPDLILLDIGLPGLNGIDIGRRVRSISPDSKILFLTQESSPEIVEEALSTGAQGYVLKSELDPDLLVAIDTVLQGRRFVSSRIDSTNSATTRDELQVSSDRPPSQSQFRHERASPFHTIGCYRDSASLVGGFVRRIDLALRIGNPVIVVATESHRSDILSALRKCNLDIEGAAGQGRYVSVDSYEALSAILVDDWPNADRLRSLCDSLVEKTVKSWSRTRTDIVVCGECAPMLWIQRRFEAAIALERLLDEIIVERHGIDLLCGYVMNDFPNERDGPAFERILTAHSASYFS